MSRQCNGSKAYSCNVLGDDEEENSGGNRRSIHMEEEEKAEIKKLRNKVIDTEDASRGPLSGVIRLADSSRVIQRLKVS